MNAEIPVYVGLAVITALSLIPLWRLDLGNYHKWSEANRRARELLPSVLSREQYRQLKRHGYLAIMSPRNPGSVYRVPRAQGLVGVIERGRCTASLYLHPLEWVPDADIVVLHKLMIEADEETCLRTANRLAPIWIGDEDE